MFTFTHSLPDMQLDKARTALVLTDMQNEFFEEATDTYYEMIAHSLKERNVIANTERLLQTAHELGIYIIHSPHWFYPHDLQWKVQAAGPLGSYLGSIGFCGRSSPIDLDGFEGSRADLYEPFKRYLKDGHACNCAPHKLFGCESNDVVKQLRMRRVTQVVMVGPAANVCLESHMRDIIEAGFEVAMVRDAVGGAANEEGDGYQAAMINWRFMANSLWTTEQAVAAMRAAV